MLQVTKIIEGGIDLLSGEKIEQGIVVANGFQEVTIPVSQETLESVVVLYAQFVEMAGGQIPAVDAPESAPAPTPLVQPQKQFSPTPVLVPQEQETFESDYDAPPPSTDISEDGFEPGEDYEDSGTGVGSL
jgi:hypothetical protein